MVLMRFKYIEEAAYSDGRDEHLLCVVMPSFLLF